MGRTRLFHTAETTLPRFGELWAESRIRFWIGLNPVHLVPLPLARSPPDPLAGW